MKTIRLHGVQVECTLGDIASQPNIDVVVNAANAELGIRGRIAGALHYAAGPGLEQECLPLAPLRPGQAVATGGHDLANRFVIHCVGPVYGRDGPIDELLASCYRNALRLAEGIHARSIAFPAISTGAFGVPMTFAAQIALKAVAEELPSLRAVKLVRYVLHYEVHRQLYERLLKEMSDWAVRGERNRSRMLVGSV